MVPTQIPFCKDFLTTTPFCPNPNCLCFFNIYSKARNITKIIQISSRQFKEFGSSDKVKDVSSANWFIKYSELFILKPFMFGFILIAELKMSTHMMKIHGLIGSPCQTPRQTLKKWNSAHYSIHNMNYYYKKFFIHFIKDGPNP